MENFKISIIVPVYNVEKYIESCVKSLLIQDYSNIEIILVDDGSTDKSFDILNKIKSEDHRIKVLHKENGGVSTARNMGIKYSTGDYLMFVDGDDWVEKDYVTYFVNLIQSTHCNIGMNTSNYYIDKITEVNKTLVLSAEKAIEWIYSEKIFVAVWNKIYSKEIFKKLKFNDTIWYGEGMLFNVQALQLVDKVAIGNKAVYHQTFNINSAMRKFNLQSNYCGICSLWLQRAIWKKKSKEIENQWKYHLYRFNGTIIEGLYRTKQIESNKVAYKECVTNIRKNILIPLFYEKSVKRKLGWICYFFFPRVMAKRSYNRFLKNRNL